ncbi:MAG: 3'-5' exonuclease, partial [Arachnia sp.]
GGGRAAPHDWAMLFAAMIAPTRSNIVLAAATDLLGFTFAGMVNGGEDSVAASVLVHRLARAHASGGVPEVMTILVTETNLGARVLSRPGGNRALTDLHHVAELLSSSGTRDLHDTAGWLQDARDGSAVEGADTRLASESPAIRVTTMHSAKGMQYGVVLLPEVSDLVSQSRKPFPVIIDGVRHLYVGPPLSYQDPTRQEFERQQREEELRLLYVALTRAQYMSIAWHVTGKRSQTGSLTALLARDRSTTVLKDRYARVPERLGLDPDLVHLSALNDTSPAPIPLRPSSTASLHVATLSRAIDSTWRRTSYSGLTAGLHELGQTLIHGDEPAEVDVYQSAPSHGMAMPSPMAGLPGGAAFGTLVHEALEALDWRPGHLLDSAVDVVAHLAPRFGMSAEDADVLADSLVRVCSTPLGALADGVTLGDISLDERLPELDFDMPMSELGAAATVGDLATLMAQHLDPADPLAAYPPHLAASPAATGVLRGFLTGSIDAVLRTPSGRYVVVDYKTNRLPTGPDEELSVGHYQGPAMAEAMMHAHYPLQALLYAVALHRFLSWRLPGYAPETHLGGAGYLFVRGMGGSEAPESPGMPCGVFTWHPPSALVVAASELLKGAP